ncbi:MAG: triose-phosphate isomerase [Calditerrivibrio sp.]|nr:triose-phosphate isomerase [Calditerrivibrio sp.]MCA1932735.1 triose-phosphate isomerase [Calditerrivibrio sp.]MCA1979907.1 triose-phosphate isomerase [Calditerrivibrio sp.]
MRKPLLAANWKMNMTLNEVKEFIKVLNDAQIDYKEKDILIAPPYIYLQELKKRLKKVKISSQNIYFEESGAFTGEISPTMLMSIGIDWTIIGHSERRQLFGDTDDIINKKLLLSIQKGLNVILCVGEKLQEREAGIEKELVISQLGLDLKDVTPEMMKNVVIAYEPVWAIGTGKTAKSQDAEDMNKAIRDFLKRRFGRKISNNTRILYGGSVKPENIKELMSRENIDGALVGGASLKPDSFLKIVNF